MNDQDQMIGDMTADTALCNLLSIITDKPSDEVSDIVQRDFKSVHHVLKATPEQLNRLDSSDAIEAIHYVNKIVQSIEEAKIREQELLSSYTAVLSYIRTRLLASERDERIKISPLNIKDATQHLVQFNYLASLNLRLP